MPRRGRHHSRLQRVLLRITAGAAVLLVASIVVGIALPDTTWSHAAFVIGVVTTFWLLLSGFGRNFVPQVNHVDVLARSVRSGYAYGKRNAGPTSDRGPIALHVSPAVRAIAFYRRWWRLAGSVLLVIALVAFEVWRHTR